MNVIDDKEVIRRYLAGENMPQIGKIFGVNPSTIGRHLFKMGVPARQPIKLDDKEVIRRYLAGENTIQIGKSMGVSYERVRCGLWKAGVPIRPRSVRQRDYQCNHRCFQRRTIDSMYYAGLLMADGNISRDGKLVQIELIKKDRILIDGLKQFTEYTGKIETRIRKKKSGKKSKMVILRVTSPEMAQDLAVFGVKSRKSKRGKIPKWIVRHPLAEFYFRGIFDGDGCAGIRRGKHSFGKKFATFGGTPAVVRAFRKWVWMMTGEKGGLSKRKTRFWVVNYSYHSVPKIGRALYGHKRGMRLERKAVLM